MAFKMKSPYPMSISSGHTLAEEKRGNTIGAPTKMALPADTLDRVSKAKKAESDAEQTKAAPAFNKNRPERMVGRIEKAEAAGKTKKAKRIKANLPSAILEWQERQSNRAERRAKPFTGHKKGTMETLKRLENPKKWQTRHAAKQAIKGAVGIAALGAGVSGLFGSSTFGGRWTPWKKSTKK